MTNKEKWEKEFDEKVNELRQDIEGKIVYFGYKVTIGNEKFTVTDWGNIKKFISQLLEEKKEKTIEECVEELRGGCWPKGENEYCDGWQECLEQLKNLLKKE